MNLIVMTVGLIWGVSALAVLVIFAVDERAHRRRTSARPVDTTSITTPYRSARGAQLVSSSAR